LTLTAVTALFESGDGKGARSSPAKRLAGAINEARARKKDLCMSWIQNITSLLPRAPQVLNDCSEESCGTWI
jgi:hypothetical protein